MPWNPAELRELQQKVRDQGYFTPEDIPHSTWTQLQTTCHGVGELSEGQGGPLSFMTDTERSVILTMADSMARRNIRRAMMESI